MNNPGFLEGVLQMVLLTAILAAGTDLALSGVSGGKVQFRLTKLVLRDVTLGLAGAVWLAGIILREVGSWLLGIARALNSHLRARPAAHGHHGGHPPHP